MSAVKRHTYALSQSHYRCLPLKNIGTSDIGRDVIMDSIASLAKMHPSMSVFDWKNLIFGLVRFRQEECD